MILFRPLPISEARELVLSTGRDQRGSFTRTWSAPDFAEAHLDFIPIQGNSSFTAQRGTVRGMHFQREPKAEPKIVRCSRGRIWDVVVDLRPESPTFRQSCGLELSDKTATAIYLPRGCAHGFQTLEDEVIVEYLMGEEYTPALADGFRYDDPETHIDWPLPARLVSEKDLAWPPLRERDFWLRQQPASIGRLTPG